MARFDVYRDAEGGLFVDIKADHLDRVNRLILIPLLPIGTAPTPVTTLNPVLEIDGNRYALMTQYLASVQRSAFTQPIDNLTRDWDDIGRALDLLFTGF